MGRLINFFRLINQIRLFLRWSLPYVWQVIGFGLGLVVSAFFTFWSGVPYNVDLMAREWRDRALMTNIPNQWDKELLFLLKIVGWVSVIVGWVILSYITVFLVQRLIFKQ